MPEITLLEPSVVFGKNIYKDGPKRYCVDMYKGTYTKLTSKQTQIFFTSKHTPNKSERLAKSFAQISPASQDTCMFLPSILEVSSYASACFVCANELTVETSTCQLFGTFSKVRSISSGSAKRISRPARLWSWILPMERRRLSILIVLLILPPRLIPSIIRDILIAPSVHTSLDEDDRFDAFLAAGVFLEEPSVGLFFFHQSVILMQVVCHDLSSHHITSC